MTDPPRPDPDAYRRQAEQAEEMARRAASEDERRSFENIAKLWRGLAERAAPKG